jgi:formate dehydrogenase subunit delta
MSNTEHLAQMANDIGHYFRAQGTREEAIAGITNHIRSFWTKRMRNKLYAQLALGNEELEELPAEALRRLETQSTPKPDQPPGGDAG